MNPTSVGLAWDAAADDVGVVAYDIYQQGQYIRSVAGGTLAVNVTGQPPNAELGFYVNARDETGNLSQASATVWVKTPLSESSLSRSARTSNGDIAVG